MRRAVATLPLFLLLGAAAPAHAQEPEYTKETVHVDTTVGPDDQTHCDVVADIYKPAAATAATPAPVILTTNGFGGSKDDQGGPGRRSRSAATSSCRTAASASAGAAATSTSTIATGTARPRRTS